MHVAMGLSKSVTIGSYIKKIRFGFYFGGISYSESIKVEVRVSFWRNEYSENGNLVFNSSSNSIKSKSSALHVSFFKLRGRKLNWSLQNKSLDSFDF